MYIWDFSRSVGVGSATTRNTRGLTRSTMRLIVPPLPAVSRPSNTMQILAPVDFTHSCRATSSPCSGASSASYSLRRIFVVDCSSCPAFSPAFFFFFFLPTIDLLAESLLGRIKVPHCEIR